MSQITSDKIDRKYEAYRKYIDSIDDEFLNYEYADILGDEFGEVDLYSREMKIQLLMDQMAVHLYEEYYDE